MISLTLTPPAGSTGASFSESFSASPAVWFSSLFTCPLASLLPSRWLLLLPPLLPLLPLAQPKAKGMAGLLGALPQLRHFGWLVRKACATERARPMQLPWCMGTTWKGGVDLGRPGGATVAVLLLACWLCDGVQQSGLRLAAVLVRKKKPSGASHASLSRQGPLVAPHCQSCKLPRHSRTQ